MYGMLVLVAVMLVLNLQTAYATICDVRKLIHGIITRRILFDV